MIKNKFSKILFLLATILANGWLWSSVLASTSDGNVTVGVTVPVSGMYCGDGTCNNGEMCSSCAGDCGACVSCFAGGTNILMADGLSKKIEQIVPGDRVASFDFILNRLSFSVVKKIESPIREGYFLLNDRLKLTSEHPLYFRDQSGVEGWGAIDPVASRHDHMLQYADFNIGQINVGDEILKADYTWEKVDSLEYTSRSTQTYNLVGLHPYNNYFADGYLAHNKGENVPPTIFNITSSTTDTSAHVGWQATDSDGIITGCIFTYGMPARSAPFTRAGSNFAVDIVGLTQNTVYPFTIVCTDDGSASDNETGLFTTQVGVLPTLAIFNIKVNVGMSTSGILWSTNLPADSQVKYGATDAYTGEGVSDPALMYAHNLLITNLCGNTTYHYKILSDNHAGSTAETDDGVFALVADDTAPPNVSDYSVLVRNHICELFWVNPGLGAEACLVGVDIVRKENHPPSSLLDGVSVYSGLDQYYADSAIVGNVNYYYRIFTRDTSGNVSGGATLGCRVKYCGDSVVEQGVVIGKRQKVNEECDEGPRNGPWPATCSAVCTFNVPPPGCNNGRLDPLEDCESGLTISRTCSAQNPAWNAGSVKCNNSCAFDYSDCRIVPPEGFCGDGSLDVSAGEECDNAGNNGTCPSTCSSACKIQICPVCGDGTPQGTEECDNGNLNGACPASCSAACTTNNQCQPNIKCGDGALDAGEDCEVGLPIANSCGDFNIDWSEGSVACNANCTFDTSACRRGTTVPGFVHVDSSNLEFWAGARKIPLFIDGAGVVRSLVGSAITIGVPYEKLVGPPNKIILKIGSASYDLTFDSARKMYLSDIVFPDGDTTGYVEIDYGSAQTDSIAFKLSSLPLGAVRGANGGLAGVKVDLYTSSGELFSGGNYGQLNPVITDSAGGFGWVVPNGVYYLTLEAGGYYSHQTQKFSITNNVVNRQIQMTKKPITILEVIPANIQRAIEAVKETVDNPAVEQVATQVVAPAAVGIVAVGTMSLISLSNLWAFLQLLFLQPILLLGRRKRENWGQVYNSLSKLPVDLAIVRLVDVATGKILRSRVTDKHGRYIFIVDPGKYRLEVYKTGFISPTKLLMDFKSDGKKIDLYHGEVVEVVAADTTITANIPVDPSGVSKTPKRLYVEKVLRHIQVIVAWTGLVITVVALYISPKWYMWVILVVHIVLFFLFRRLATVPKPKGWGIVYDEQTKKPLDRAIARLFDSHFNKLVSTELTDKNGRYTFLAADSQFYVTYEHPGYDQTKTSDIDLRGKEESTIAVDAALKKAGETPPPANAPQPPQS